MAEAPNDAVAFGKWIHCMRDLSSCRLPCEVDASDLKISRLYCICRARLSKICNVRRSRRRANLREELAEFTRHARLGPMTRLLSSVRERRMVSNHGAEVQSECMLRRRRL